MKSSLLCINLTEWDICGLAQGNSLWQRGLADDRVRRLVSQLPLRLCQMGVIPKRTR